MYEDPLKIFQADSVIYAVYISFYTINGINSLQSSVFMTK